jgi:hypothetical protein
VVDVRGEEGLALVLVTLCLVILLCMSAFAVDLGRAYFTQRTLQASADAAALAGAQELPDPGLATAVAGTYDGKAGSKNAHHDVDVISSTITTKCLTSAPSCEPVNAVVVEQTARVSTTFAKVFGIDHIDVDAKATACSPCGAKPLDIVIVQDRTGSMCQFSSGASDPGCTDLNNARDGIKTFLRFLDSSIDWVGYAVFPPAPSLGQRCATPSDATYHNPSAPYLVVPLSKDFTSGPGTLNPASALVQTVDCIRANGRTSYATALEHAQAELDRNGRPEVQDVIIFFTDGAANYAPSYYPAGSPYRKQPCHQAISSAGAAKARGTIVYSIGYDIDADGGICHDDQFDVEVPGITTSQTLGAIASDPLNFYNKPNPGQLRTIFTKIAADLAKGTARLVDDNKS